MSSSFEPEDRRSWYFGPISRQDATDLLMSEGDGGVFLVRDSSSIPGDYVLCVKEDCKVCHYIINKVEGGKYRIGDRAFNDLPSLLRFYKLHYLDTTPLVRPAARRLEKVVAKHDFDGVDNEDLPFKKGETLTVIRKHEEQWWTARNALGRVGAIPVPYIRPWTAEGQGQGHGQGQGQGPASVTSEEGSKPAESAEQRAPSPPNSNTNVEHSNNSPRRPFPEGKESFARVKQARVPNAYDDTALKLEVGDILRVTKINISGQWEGEQVVGGRKGHFPFTHVELLDHDYDPGTEGQGDEGQGHGQGQGDAQPPK